VALANTHIPGAPGSLPEVATIFEGLVEEKEFQPREIVSRQFLRAAYTAADVVMRAHILHDGDLDIKRMLIRKPSALRKRRLPRARMHPMTDRSTNALGLMMSLTCMIETTRWTFTGAMHGLMKDAGFKNLNRVEHMNGPHSMVIATSRSVNIGAKSILRRPTMFVFSAPVSDRPDPW